MLRRGWLGGNENYAAVGPSLQRARHGLAAASAVCGTTRTQS